MDPTFSEIFEVLSRELESKFSQSFSALDRSILEHSWNGDTYASMSEQLGVDQGSLRAHHAVILWGKVAKIYGLPQIRKKKFREIALQRYCSADPKTMQASIAQEIKILGGQVPQSKYSDFFGREVERMSLHGSLIDSQCILLYGPSGIGKTALAQNAANEITLDNSKTRFFACIWRGLHHKPKLKIFLVEILHICGVVSASHDLDTEVLLSKFVEEIRKNRYLFIIDGMECLFANDSSSGHKNSNQFSEEYADYHKFLLQISQEQHQSCFLITSQDPIDSLKVLENKGYPVTRYKIESLGKANIKILKSLGLEIGSSASRLIDMYRGNPGMLVMIASLINEFFDGNIDEYINHNSTIGMDAYSSQVLNHLHRLNVLDARILCLIADVGRCSMSSLRESLGNVPSLGFFDAIKRLQDNSLIEISHGQRILTLQPALKKVVLSHLKPERKKLTSGKP